MRRWTLAIAVSTLLGSVAAAQPTPKPDLPSPPALSELSDGQEFDDCSGAGWCPRMVVVPAGNFTMGSAASEPGRGGDESPQHPVSIARFAAGRYEVTFAEWDACAAGGGCTNNPVPSDSGWGRGQHPVMNVSWRDAQDYASWLSRRTGQVYRLLSEAEWEYVARAGTQTRFWWGRNTNPRQAQYNWSYNGAPTYSAPHQTANVGSFAANAFGLYDVHGNISEWVADCYRDSYVGAPQDGSAVAPQACAAHVLRGGSWNDVVPELRSAERIFPAYGEDGFWMWGFRVARDLSTHGGASAPASVVWVEQLNGHVSNHPYGALFMRSPHPPDGHADLDCVIQDDGALRCTLIRETPTGHGFGAAALRGAGYYRARATLSDDTTPSAGVRTQLTIYFPGPGL